MARKVGSKKRLLAQVQEELERDGLNDQDEEYEPDEQRIFPFGLRPKKTEEERAIDEMFAGVDESKGFYFILEKEMGPNNWEIKERIDKFKHWSDVQWEITNIVRGKTRLEIESTGKALRWGTGRYRITVRNNFGTRGDKRPPVHFDIDAQEYEIKTPQFPGGVPPAGASNDMTQISEMLKTLNIFNQNLSPAEVQKQNADSLRMGLELAVEKEKAGASGQSTMLQLMMTQQQESTKMMLGLITAMMTAMSGKAGPDPMTMFRDFLGSAKDMGAFRTETSAPQPKDPLDTLLQWKSAGLIDTPKKEDPFEQFTKFKQFASLLQDFSGAGPAERPGIIEKLVDTLGPKLPEMLNNIKETVANAAELKRAGVGNRRPINDMRRPLPPVDTIPEAYNPYGNRESEQTDMFDESDTDQEDHSEMISPLQIMRWKNDLYKAVMEFDQEQFELITNTLARFLGGRQVIEEKAQSGEITTDELFGYVVMFDKGHYKTPEEQKRLKEYISEYIASFRSPDDSSQSSEESSEQLPETDASMAEDLVVITCPVCRKETEFTNKEQYEEEKKFGPVLCGLGTPPCTGELRMEDK